MIARLRGWGVIPYINKKANIYSYILYMVRRRIAFYISTNIIITVIMIMIENLFNQILSQTRL